MKKSLFYITIVLVIISSGYAKPVEALYIVAPSDVSVSYISDTSIKLNYKTNNTNSNYKVQIFNSTLGEIYTTEVNTTSYTVTGLEFGITYNFLMRVHYKTVTTTYKSNWTSVISATPRAKAPTITGITAADKSVTLNYKVTGSPKGVQIYNGNTKKVTSTTNLTSYTYTGLTNGTKYKFIIRNYYGNSIYGPWSNPVEGIPNASKSNTNKSKYIACSGKIGQATHDERKKTKGGKAGDQSGREVAISNWSYNKTSGKYNHWVYIARIKDSNKANKAAEAMEQACANNNIGYDQKPNGGRIELYNAAKQKNFDLSKITKKVETSCSPLVFTCISCAGISVPQSAFKSDTRNSNMKTYFKNRPNTFIILTDKKYLTTYKNLKRGDILVSPGHHVAMAL